MNYKDIICDVKYSVKLKELGIVQDSLFTYGSSEGKVSGFTSEELLGILPKLLNINTLLINPKILIEDGKIQYLGHQVGYTKRALNNELVWDIEFSDKKLSNSLAKLLIWCVENGYVEVK